MAITKTSTDLAAFVACREALVTTAYSDGPHMSIGFGSNDPTLKVGDTITVQDAFARLKKDISAREPIVAKVIKAPVNQQQFDAIFDLFYQSGTVALYAIAGVINACTEKYLNASFPPLVDRVDLDPISIEFQNHAVDINGGQTVVNPGLLKRRNMEIDMFWGGNYGDLSKILVYDGNPHAVHPTSMPFDYESFGS